MFYQILVVLFCAVQVIISPSAGNPLAEDLSRFNHGGLNHDGK
jgi:hypothetical protein